MQTRSDCRWATLLLIPVLFMTALPGMAKTPDPQSSPSSSQQASQRLKPDQASPAPNRSNPQQVGQSTSRRFTFEGRGAPASTLAGGRRNNNRCPEDTDVIVQPTPGSITSIDGLMPLVPTKGTTIFDRPNILVYVPQTSAKQLAFILEDENNNELYRTRVNVANSPQVLGIRPQASLEVGKKYYWTISMVCPTPGPANPFVEGTVQRVQVDRTLADQLKPASKIDQAALFAQSGLWFEASNTLFELKQTDPKNTQYSDAWKELLQSVGLGRMATVTVAR